MDLTLLFPLIILVLFVPIFLSARKQKRQVAEMQTLQAALEPGDVVVTTSGLRGIVVDASYEDTIDLEISDGVVTTWLRAAVREKVALPDEADAHSDTAHTDEHTTDPAVESGPTGAPAVEAAPAPAAENGTLSLEKNGSLEKSADPASDGAARN